jgi:hypothetical protein
MKKINKLTIQLALSVILVLFGIGLLIASFIVPPHGVIDSSVLVAYGETLTFSGALIGVDYSYKYKIRRDNDDE